MKTNMMQLTKHSNVEVQHNAEYAEREIEREREREREKRKSKMSIYKMMKKYVMSRYKWLQKLG